MKALVVSEDSHARGALAAVRSLGTSGWSVGVGSPEKGTLAASRWCRRWHAIPAPGEPSGNFVASINAAIRDGGYGIVFGAGDAGVLALTEHRSKIEAKVPYPSHDTVRRSMDKLALPEAARAADLRTPYTTVDLDEALDASAPVIVKPRWHWAPSGEGRPLRLEATVCYETSEVARRASEITSLGGQPLFQEMVSGRLGALTLLVDSSHQIVARAQQHATRIWPPAAGVSARATTIPVDEELATKAGRLLEDLGWFGLAELQFIDVGDGCAPLLIDLNGRFFGSMSLAIAAGVDFPSMWASMAVGTRLSGNLVEATPGLRFQWLVGDLHRAVVERRRGVVRDVVDSVRYARGAKESVWCGRDWRPAVPYLRSLAAQAIRRR